MLHITIYINKVYSGVTKLTYSLEIIKALITSSLKFKKSFCSFTYFQKDNCKCYVETTVPKNKDY